MAPGAYMARIGPGRRASRVFSPRRVLVLLVLPLAILPVMIFGPTLLHSPIRLGRQAGAALVRLERRLAPATHAPREPIGRGLKGRPIASLGPIYGRWTRFPGPGVQRLGRHPRDRARTAIAARRARPAAALSTLAPSPSVAAGVVPQLRAIASEAGRAR